MIVIKKDKQKEIFSIEKIISAIILSANRCRVFSTASENSLNSTEEKMIRSDIIKEIGILESQKRRTINVSDIHKIVENSLLRVAPDIFESYSNFRNYKSTQKKEYYKLNEICIQNSTTRNYDNANSNNLSSVAQKMLSASTLERSRFNNFFVTASERESMDKGEIYCHDETDRLLYSMNCCLFDMELEFKNSLNVSGVIYNEPKGITTACKMLADITMAASANQYGGFTVCRVDNFMSKYLEMTFYKELQLKLCTAFKTLMVITDKIELEDSENISIKRVLKKIEYEFPFISKKALYNILKEKTVPSIPEDKFIKIIYECIKDANENSRLLGMKGFEGIEWTLNSVFSSRGDFPFISITFGLGSTYFEKEITKIILKVRENGIGPNGFEQASLFPKLIFLYDENIHGEGCICNDIFEDCIICSSKCQYPDYFSLTGDEKLNPESCGIYKNYIDKVRVIPKDGIDKSGRIIKPYKFKIYCTYKELVESENEEMIEALDKTIKKYSKKNYDLINKSELYCLHNQKDKIGYIFNKIKLNSGLFENIFLAAKKEIWPIPATQSMGCRSQLGSFYSHV